jgi:hypothetical protein
MTALDLIARVSDLVAQHGDLEVVFDCDFVITEIGSVELLGDPAFSDAPVFVIYPPAQE